MYLDSAYFMHAWEEKHNSLWVCDWHLQNEVFGDLKQLGVIAVGLQQKGEHVETTLRSLPPELDADLPKSKSCM